MYAYCWRSGLIEFGKRVPCGAREIVRGPRKIIKQALNNKSRHDRDGRSLLVPAIPEAKDDNAAYWELHMFRQEVWRIVDNLLLEKLDKNRFQEFEKTKW